MVCWKAVDVLRSIRFSTTPSSKISLCSVAKICNFIRHFSNHKKEKRKETVTVIMIIIITI